MKSNLNLNWLRTFESAARLSSFTAAAKELGLTQVAVSQQIKSLETKLGQDLFVRHPKKVQLNEAGKAYLPSVRDGLEKLAYATYGLFGSDIDRTIVVRSSMAVLMWLTPRLNDFHQRFPKIRLKLVTSFWPDPVDTQKIDIDIALLPSTKHAGSIEKLSDECIVPICGCQAAENVSSISELGNLKPIHIAGYDDHWARYMNHTDLSSMANISNTTQVQVDTSVLACTLVESGVGCAIVIERFATGSVEAGRAIRIIGEPVPLHQSHFLVETEATSKETLSAEIEAFKEWLRIEFST